MTNFEKEIYEKLKGKEVCDYTDVDTIVIFSEVIGSAKNNIGTTRAKVEAREFENILTEASNLIEHKYSELLDCVLKMKFIIKDMQRNIPNAEEYFYNAIEWLRVNGDKNIEQKCDKYYMRATWGNMFQ